MSDIKPKIKEAFFERVARDSDSACWLWIAGKDGHGYGAFHGDSAHRMSWKIHNGRIPNKMCVCHSCDVPACVNPDHLFLGTHRDNMMDKTRKNRQARGEMMKRNKLTSEEAIQIILLPHTHESLAKRFNVSETLIWAIKHKKCWGHLHDEIRAKYPGIIIPPSKSTKATKVRGKR